MSHDRLHPDLPRCDSTSDSINDSTVNDTHDSTRDAVPAAGPLARLGYDDAWADALTGTRTVEVQPCPRYPARVVRTDKGACDLLAELGPVRATWGADILAAVAGDPMAVPSTGDWAVVQPWPDGRTTVEAVLPRRSCVTRAQVNGSSAGQVLAANVDVVAVVEGLVPDPDLGRVERLLALAWQSGATPRLVLTKGDLAADATELAADIGASVAAGCPVDVTAAHEGRGLDELRSILGRGATVALLGASGVGKSTLLNALVGATLMRTQSLGAVQKGRHTTVTRELHLAAGGGAVIDTPGLRSVGLAGGEGLREVFADVEELALDCRFTDCAHESEPDCAVLAAVESGELAERRLASWRKLQREAAFQARRVDARLRQAEVKVWKQRARDARTRTRP
ncbi:MAG TPA: ribosome small subunit-dependent GTPase A [Actinomycetales bacterium]|nr:ribosome small subunit-dependent GTPase A [Actinomycetales bacterium]